MDFGFGGGCHMAGGSGLTVAAGGTGIGIGEMEVIETAGDYISFPRGTGLGGSPLNRNIGASNRYREVGQPLKPGFICSRSSRTSSWARRTRKRCCKGP
jgi:hypothetical protein